MELREVESVEPSVAFLKRAIGNIPAIANAGTI
jgi:hypothetical protein